MRTTNNRNSVDFGSHKFAFIYFSFLCIFIIVHKFYLKIITIDKESDLKSQDRVARELMIFS